MSIILFLANVCFWLWIARNVLFWTALWQTKEYRFDRMRAHLTDTTEGRRLYFSPILFAKLAAILSYGAVVFNSISGNAYDFLVSIIFIWNVFYILQEIRFHQIKRPQFTGKAIVIIALSLGLLFVLFWVPLFDQALWLLLLDRLLPLFIAFFVYVFSFPTDAYKDFQVQKAIEKIRGYKKLLVIGVTGSYGKSTTKEFIAQILRKKFRVAKTKGTNNTPIGIANTVLSVLQPNTDILVVEMGAYKIGEITEICQIVHPKIGVLTAVNEQHASLFGGLAKTKQAKYELIESLPKTGLALFNGNNENALALYQKTIKKKALYVCGEDHKADIRARNIAVFKTYITFDVSCLGKKLSFRAPVIGRHNVENMLPGIYLGFMLGMKKEEITQAVSSLVPPAQTMVRHEIGGVSMVDDAFTANPQSVISALDYMKIYKGKRLLVLQPMIELGKYAASEHKRIGRAIGNVCDVVLLTNKNYYSEILQGVQEGKRKCSIHVENPAQIAAFISKKTKMGDVVVFEGREAGLSLVKLL